MTVGKHPTAGDICNAKYVISIQYIWYNIYPLFYLLIISFKSFSIFIKKIFYALILKRKSNNNKIYLLQSIKTYKQKKQ